MPDVQAPLRVLHETVGSPSSVTAREVDDDARQGREFLVDGISFGEHGLESFAPKLNAYEWHHDGEECEYDPP